MTSKMFPVMRQVWSLPLSSHSNGNVASLGTWYIRPFPLNEPEPTLLPPHGPALPPEPDNNSNKHIMSISFMLGCMLNTLFNLYLQTHEEGTITLNLQFPKGDWPGEVTCLKTQLARKHSSPGSLPPDWWGGRSALPVDSPASSDLSHWFCNYLCQ